MQKGKRKKLLLMGLPIIVCSLLGWWWFFLSSVEWVVPKWELRDGWLLSPGRDKIIYTTNNDIAVLMYLSTGQKKRIDDCYGFRWLDNTIFHCRKFIVDSNDLVKTSFKTVDVSEINLDELLIQAETIYARKSKPTFIFILAKDYKNNPDKNYYITNIENIDQALQEYDHITVPRPDYNASQQPEKVYSPNGAYYYSLESTGNGNRIAIYDALTNKQLSRSSETSYIERYEIAGWDAESSGVYFQTFPTGFLPLTGPSGINKLKVP